MKKVLGGRTVNIVLGVGIVVLAGVIVWRVFDIGTRLDLHEAVRDIVRGREPAKARQTLREINDRGKVLEALLDALADDDDRVQGKVNILESLTPGQFNQPRVIERSLDAKVAATRRAAASLMYRHPDHQERCKTIVLDWLNDEGADLRSRAMRICGELQIKEALPFIEKIVDQAGDEDVSREDAQMIAYALQALKEFEVAGLASKLIALVKNGKLPDTIRAPALETVGAMDDAPRDEVQALALGILENRRESKLLRIKGSAVLRRFPDEKSWAALEKVLLDPEETQQVTQRQCLYSLGRTAPLDRVKKIVLDRRVWKHRYFGIRIDVASALATLEVKERIALDILCEYLVDEDKNDTQKMVRQDAWLTLWTLTKTALGPTETEVFRRPPRAPQDDELIREWLFKASFSRLGIQPKQVRTLDPYSRDLKEMKRFRQLYQQQFDTFLQTWKDEEEKERQIERENAAKDDEKKIEKSGPVPPKKDDDGKDGK